MRAVALIWVAFCAAACLAANRAAAQPAETSASENTGGSLPVLTKVADVFQVPRDTDNVSFPVDLKGVVILTVQETASFFFHDGQMGVHVSQPGGPRFKTGDKVRVTGATRRGRYAPSIVPRTILRLGDGMMPEPRLVSFSQVASGSMDSQWVELEGVVSAITAAPDKRQWGLDVSADGGRLRVVAGGSPPEDSDSLLDSEVRIRGVATGRFNRQGQMIEPMLRVLDQSSVKVTQPGPADPFALPLRPTNRLLEFSFDPQPQHRVKVQGVVTRRLSGTTFFLRGDGHGLKVETRNPVTLQSGDRVEAVGFPVIANDEVVIQNAVSRRISAGPPPAPLRSDLSALLKGSRASDLVSIQARLVDSVADGPNTTLILEAKNRLFKGLLRHANGDSATVPENGSLVDVTGICVISELKDLWYFQPHSFLLLLATPVDLRVLQSPPWWTAERLWRALLVTLALLAAGAAWVWALRRQVRRKRSVIEYQASHAAVLEERSRIARDLHDTLEQGLTGVSLQLKSVETNLTGNPLRARVRLLSAREMLRQCRALARNAIRELRMESEPSPHEDVVTALQNTADLWNHSGALTVRLSVAGEPCALPGEIEHHLVGVGTEAMTNAVKHGRASSVQIDLTFGPELISLRVEDNGTGFDPDRIPGAPQGCFGLVGMRERAREMGARLEVRSEPGRGAAILVEVPLATVNVRPRPTERTAPSPATTVSKPAREFL